MDWILDAASGTTKTKFEQETKRFHHEGDSHLQIYRRDIMKAIMKEQDAEVVLLKLKSELLIHLFIGTDFISSV